MDTLDEYFRSIAKKKKLEDMIYAYGMLRIREYNQLFSGKDTVEDSSDALLNEILAFVGNV